MERTLVIIKPDAVQRGLIGEILGRLEKRGLKLIALKYLIVDGDLASSHYAIHAGKPFYNGLIKYISSAPVVAMVWEGPHAISSVRKTMGATNPDEAEPGSIRHDYSLEIGRNLTHASDSEETAEKEIDLWFNKSEIIPWDRNADPWLFGKN